MTDSGFKRGDHVAYRQGTAREKRGEVMYVTSGKHYGEQLKIRVQVRWYSFHGDWGKAAWVNANTLTKVQPRPGTDTRRHIEEVRKGMLAVVANLHRREYQHDLSKLREPELSAFDKIAQERTGVAYGSPEYFAMMASVQPAINHHYAENDHHPEHYALTASGEVNEDEVKQGVAVGRMSLTAILEMCCDWYAAAHRQGEFSAEKFADELEYTFKRFAIGEQLANIIRETYRELKWIPQP